MMMIQHLSFRAGKVTKLKKNSVRSLITLKSSRLSEEDKAKYDLKKKKREEAKMKKLHGKTSKFQAEIFSPEKKQMRLAKAIALSGICSRRGAEEIIKEGRVKIDGVPEISVATNVDITKDRILVDGKRMPTNFTKTRVWIANKMTGELVTASDPQGRPTIMTRIATMGLPLHLMPVGRLDFNTEGLLVLTNNGDYARSMELPKNAVERKYNVLVRGEVSESKINELKKGCLIEGIRYRPILVTIHSKMNKDTWLKVTITEGKNREIRKALAHVRLVVKRLIRTEFGPYRLGKLSKGSVREVKPQVL